MNTIYKVGDEPSKWTGETVLGWMPSKHKPVEFFGEGQWDAVIWHAGPRYWAPGGEGDTTHPATHLMAMPLPPLNGRPVEA